MGLEVNSKAGYVSVRGLGGRIYSSRAGYSSGWADTTLPIGHPGMLPISQQYGNITARLVPTESNIRYHLDRLRYADGRAPWRIDRDDLGRLAVLIDSVLQRTAGPVHVWIDTGPSVVLPVVRLMLDDGTECTLPPDGP